MPIKKKKGPGSKKIDNVNIKLRQKLSHRYTMLDDIKKSELYGKGPARDQIARDFINENAQDLNVNNIEQGQLLLFNYFEPKYQDELEYYDAGPCTIFFNVINTNEGQRVLGFNIHYYPPKIRYQIMDRIFDIFKSVYRTYFNGQKTGEVKNFDYHFLLGELDKAGLGFGVRMYIPNLMDQVKIVPPNMWKVAVFTEGWFKKATRAAIMKFWEQWARTHKNEGKRYKRRNRMKKKVKK